MLEYTTAISKLNELALADVVERWREVELVNQDERPTPAQREKLDERSVFEGGEWYSILREFQGSPRGLVDAGFMHDDAEFGWDSLFCEWGYLIDLDQRTLECYCGFQKEPHSEGRWSGPAPEGEGVDNRYVGIRLIRTYTWDELPDAAGLDTELTKLAYPEEN